MKYSVAIIGGGFSGLCAGVKLGEKFGSNLLILEGNKRVGKKIVAPGNGQGNITNEVVNSSFYHGDIDFAEKCLARYTNSDLLAFFDKLGLVTDSYMGKVYPASFTAGSITDVLRFELERLKVTVKTESLVTKIQKKDCFKIECLNGEIYFADKVVCAFGGKSGAGFLTDGKSYKLLTDLGHTLTDLSPSLVQLKTEKDKIKGLKGVKVDAKVGLYGDKQHIATFDGDLLFTDYGVSGNSIFAISAYLKGVKFPTLSIEFLPSFTSEKLKEKLIKKIEISSDWEKLLVSVLPSRIALTILKSAQITHTDKPKAYLVDRLVDQIKNFTLRVEGTAGFESSQVTAGGISTKEVAVATMQSKKVSNLFIVGETLNVDGNCGGYNLQWAFTSAMIAAEGILSAKN